MAPAPHGDGNVENLRDKQVTKAPAPHGDGGVKILRYMNNKQQVSAPALKRDGVTSLSKPAKTTDAMAPAHHGDGNVEILRNKQITMAPAPHEDGGVKILQYMNNRQQVSAIPAGNNQQHVSAPALERDGERTNNNHAQTKPSIVTKSLRPIQLHQSKGKNMSTNICVNPRKLRNNSGADSKKRVSKTRQT